MTRKATWWETAPVVGGLVCAVCCSVPLLAAVGVGSGALLRLAEVAEPLGLALLVGGAAVAVAAYVRRRVGAGPGCATCGADGGCGCAGAKAPTKG